MNTNRPSTGLRRSLNDLLLLDNLGVPVEQVNRAINRAQMRSLPFIYLSISVLYFIYALLQLFVLREPGLGVMVGVALVSGVVLLLMGWLLRNGRFPPKHATHLAAILALTTLASIQLRFYLTGEPQQVANLALFVFGTAVLFFDTRWYLFMLGLAFAGLLHALSLYAAPQDWRYNLIVFLAAGAVGLIAHISRLRAYRRTEILRIREQEQRRELERLYAEITRFNQQLEAMVAERTRELHEAYGRLEKIDKTKSDFITIASHEMLTPLTIITLNAQMFLEEEAILADKMYAGWVRGIDKGVARMREVIDVMLDVARIDNQALTLHPAPVRLLFLIRQIANRFQGALAEREIVLTLTPAPDLPEVAADAEALEKVFYHLLVNAIKYTPNGGRIVVNGRTTHLQSNGKTIPAVEISIADSGVGIAPDVQPLIFEKFYQTGEVMLHSSGKTKFKGGGFGLGLAIARGIVLAHNGRIWVESSGCDEERCPGSIFHVALPVQMQVTP
jgi:signal transduction histidine kinase